MIAISNNGNLQESINQIVAIESRGNFRTVKKEFGEAELRNILLKLYPKYTLPEIETMTGIPDSTLSRWFRELKIPLTRWHIKILSKPGNRNVEKIVKHGKKVRKEVTIKITPELAYIIGFSLGDGTIQNYMVEVFNRDRGLQAYLRPLLKIYGVVSEDERADGLWRLRLSSVRIAKLIKEDKAINAATIEYIFKRKELAKRFVAAFWDAEGRVAYNPDKKYFYIYLYNTNTHILLNIIGKFLKSRRIKYSVHSRYDSGRKYFLKGRMVIANKPIHRISIPKSHCLVWAKEIGANMQHSNKKETVKEILSLYR